MENPDVRGAEASGGVGGGRLPMVASCIKVQTPSRVRPVAWVLHKGENKMT